MLREPAAVEVAKRLRDSYALDDLWGETMGLQEGDTKEKPLRLVAEILEQEGVAYALIGGMAVQVHTSEPRTTRDIDLAVRTYADVPADALRRAGFEHTGRHQHSDNWLAPGTGSKKERTVIQFSAEEEAMVGAVDRAMSVDIGGLRLRVVTAPDLVILKLAAAEEPARRASKRLLDVVDVLTLIEEQPELRRSVPRVDERVRRIQERALTVDRER